MELCGWLTTGLGGPDGKQEDADKKNVSVVMLLKAPLIRKDENQCLSKKYFDCILGLFGEKVALALQKVHEKNGAKFYSEAQATELTVS